MAIVSGLGTTITFSGFTGVMRKVDFGGVQAQSILDITGFATTPAVEKISNGLVDGGEVTIEGIFDSTATGVAAVGTTSALSVVFPGTAGTWSADAILKSFAVSDPHNDLMTFTAVFDITGEVTAS